MNLEEILKEMVQAVEGGLGAMIMGLDGLAVAQHLAGEIPDFEGISIECCGFVKKLIQLANSMAQSIFNQFAFITSKYQILCYMVSSDYFVIFVITREGNFGKGRYLTKLAARKIKKEI